MGFSVTANTPSSGYIAWANTHLVYDGVDYAIADGNSNKKYIFWLKSAPGALQVSDTYPALTTDDCIVFLNKGGVPISVLTATATEGDLVVPGTITSSAIATGAIDASHIKSDAIIARHILAGSIVAAKLSVNELSAISANLGTMTAGNLTLNSSGFVKGGALTYSSGTGFWMGYDGGYYKFRAGTPGSSRMEWNGAAFNIYGPDGGLTISSGVVDYDKLSNQPQSLGDINSTEAGKLGGIDAGATRNVFRGTISAGVTYSPGDLVLDASGYGWNCLVTHVSGAGNQPPVYPIGSNTYWSLYIIRGADGVSGINGTRTAVLDMYRWSAAAPITFPSGSSTYTWASGQFTEPATVNGWSLTPPAPVAGQTLWVVRQAYADNVTTATSAVTWSASSSRSLAAAGTNGSSGANGTRTAVLELYQWAASAPATFPSGGSTYTWATGAFTAPATANSWSLTPGAATPGQTLWGCSVSYADADTSATSAVTWNTTVAYALGAAGINGLNGNNAKAAFLTSTSQVFQVNKSAAASPASVTLTAIGQNVTGSPTFTVTSGTATLTGTGTTRSLAYSNMSTDTVTVTMVWDSITDTITIAKVREGADGAAGSTGSAGADGASALTIVLSNEAHVFPASTAGAVSSYTGSGTTVQVYEGTTSLSASATATVSAFRIGAITQAPAGTITAGAVSYAGATATVTQHSAMVTGTDSVTLTIPITIYRADGTSSTVNRVQTLSKSKTGSVGATGPAGANAVVALLSNEAHVFPATSAGAVGSYAGSGTQVRVYEGTTELAYDGVGTANGAWAISSVVTNITRGTLTDSGTYLTVGDHSGVAAGTDTSSITYTISGKTQAGVSFTLTKAQTFSKSKAGATGADGATGPQGPAVVITGNLPTTFTATDGALDAAQSNIILTASVSGIASPTYVWSFSGFQTAPVNSGTASQTITSAQFGTSKSARVTCTVNGTYADDITVVRLEKSTAAAGANNTYLDANGQIRGVSSGSGTTVKNSLISIGSNGALTGAGGGQVTASGIGAVNVDMSNAPVGLIAGSNWDFEIGAVTGWSNITSVLTTDTDASASKCGVVAVIADNTYPGKVPVDVSRTYLTRMRVKATSALTVNAGALCYDRDGVEITSALSTYVRANCAGHGVTLAANTWTTLEGVISGEQLNNVVSNDRFKFFKNNTGSLTTAYAAPYVACTAGTGSLYVDFVDLIDVTDTWALSPKIKPHDNDTKMAFGPGYAVKVGNSAAYDCGIKSRNGHVGGFYLAFSPQKTDKQFLIGANTDPDTDATDTSIDCGIICTSTETLQYSESGTSGSLGTYEIGDLLAISFDGSTLRYYKNGVVLRESTSLLSSSATYYLDSSFYTQFAAVYNLEFSPAGVAGLGAFATASQITAANASTYIANAAIDNVHIATAAITNAKIGDAAITTAKIGNAAITTAKIGDLQVDTLKIAGNAVTMPIGAYTAATYTKNENDQVTISDAPNGVPNWFYYKIQEVTFVSTGAPIFITGGAAITAYDKAFFIPTTRLIRSTNNGVTWTTVGYSGGTSAISVVDTPGVGQVRYCLVYASGTYDTAAHRSLFCLEVKR